MCAQGLRSTFDKQVASIEDDLLRMQGMVDQAIKNALDSLKRRDRPLAEEVVEGDKKINDLRFKIEQACLALIATQQPAASDLRSIIAAMNIVVDMERMADHAAGIAKTVIMMGDEPLLKPLIDIPRMAHIAREMLRDSLDAYRQRDTQKARVAAARDEEMDRLYKAIFDELVEIMAQNPENAQRATYLLWCGHNLERIGDRVTNIAERVVFISTGDITDLNK